MRILNRLIIIISGGNKKLNGGKVESKNKRVAFFPSDL